MLDHPQILWPVLALTLGLTALFWPRHGLLAAWRAGRDARRRIRIEDALKHILTLRQAGRTATRESLAGALRLSTSRALNLIQRMEEADLIHTAGEGLALTDAGRELAAHVLRAHRLWERYLRDDAGMGLSELHREAERREHLLTADQVNALNAHLGHPSLDPHGDPIPGSPGEERAMQRSVLADWPVDTEAQVVHVEDEPAQTMRQLERLGVQPGTRLVVTDRQAGLVTLRIDDETHTLGRAAATNVHVKQAEQMPQPVAVRSLASLRIGQTARVSALSQRCQGLTRRRLLDLGLTPGVMVKAELANAGRKAQAYRVRDTLIALRNEQAALIEIEPPEQASAGALAG